MNNIASAKGAVKWGVLLDGNNRAIRFGEIIDFKDGVIIFESFGQYPERLVLVFDSADKAQQSFESMVSGELDKSICEECF